MVSTQSGLTLPQSCPLLSSFPTCKREHQTLTGSYHHTTQKVKLEIGDMLVPAKLQYGMELGQLVSSMALSLLLIFTPLG